MSATRIIFMGKLLAVLMLTFKFYNAYRFKMTNAVCESYNKTWVAIKDCRLRAISRNKTTLNILINITEPANDITVRFRLLKKENGYKPWMMDYNFDVCQVFRKNNHPMAKIIVNTIKSTSTFNHSCPYVGIHMLKDFYRADNIPLVPPTGDYLISFTWKFHKKLVGQTKIYYTFVDEF